MYPFPSIGGICGVSRYISKITFTLGLIEDSALSFVLKLLHNPAASQVPELSPQERWGCVCRPIESYLIISCLVGNCFIPELSSQSSALEKWDSDVWEVRVSFWSPDHCPSLHRDLWRAVLDAVISVTRDQERGERLGIQISLSVSVLPNGGSVSELNSKGWGE